MQKFCLNAEWVEASAAVLPASAAFIDSGEGWVDTLRIEQGRPMFVAAHLQRFLAGVQGAGLDCTAARLAYLACLSRMSEIFDCAPTARLRVVISPDICSDHWHTLGVWMPYEPPRSLYKSGVRLCIASFAHPRLGFIGKSASYHWSRIARREAERAEVDDVLLCAPLTDTDYSLQRIIESSSAAVLWLRDGHWFYDPHAGAVHSCTLESLQISNIGQLMRTDLQKCEGLLLVSALKLVVPVREVQGILLPDACVHANEFRHRLLNLHQAQYARTV